MPFPLEVPEGVYKNSVGYTLDNIQLVHKKVNMMRGSLSVDEFNELCAAVTNKVKW